MARRESELIRRLRELGCQVESSGSSHWKVWWQGRMITVLTGTGRDVGHRKQNELAQLRRAGIPI